VGAGFSIEHHPLEFGRAIGEFPPVVIVGDELAGLANETIDSAGFDPQFDDVSPSGPLFSMAPFTGEKVGAHLVDFANDRRNFCGPKSIGGLPCFPSEQVAPRHLQRAENRFGLAASEAFDEHPTVAASREAQAVLSVTVRRTPRTHAAGCAADTDEALAEFVERHSAGSMAFPFSISASRSMRR